MRKFYVFFIFSIFYFFNLQGQHTGDFRSMTGGSGNWNDYNAWEIYNGIVWSRASKGMLPSVSSEVEINAGDTIFVKDSLPVSCGLKVNGILKFCKTNDCQIKVHGNAFVGKTGKVISLLPGSVFTHLLLTGGKISVSPANEALETGIYAIGPKTSYNGYEGSFLKLGDAVAAISSLSLNGNLIFEFQPDYNPSVETYPISLNSNISSSETSTITFRPASTVNSVINFSTSGTVLNNTGADFIIFDGRNGGSGSNHYLQFENKDISHSTISLSNDALQNKFLYCTLTGFTKAADTGILTLNSPKSGNNFNTVDHCDFNGNGSVNNCIYTKGLASDLSITNNNFFDFRNGAGINIVNGSNNLIIDNNNFYQTKSYSGIEGATSGIIVKGGANCRISNNNIGGNSAGLNGTWTVSDISLANYSFTGISATSLATTSKIYNNKIQNINWKSNLSNWTGIFVSGVVKVGTDGANYIGNNTGNNNIVLTYYSDGASSVIGINSDREAIIENNVIGSFTTLLNGITGTGVNFTGIYSTGTGIINQNTIGSSTISKSINISQQSKTGFSQNLYGIYSYGTSSVITNNIIANLWNGATVSSGVTCGILVLFTRYATILTVNSNNIHSISTSQPVTALGTSTGLHGINIQEINSTNIPTVTITGNSIYDLINLCNSEICINGILFSSSTASGNKVDKNIIHSFKSASNYAIQNGINIISGSATFQNNVIRLGIDVTGNSITNTVQINGISKSSENTCHFYFNTVYIGGSNVLAGSVKTFALNFSMKSVQNENLKNNIFINMRNNAISNKLNYAVLWPAFGANNWSSDYNIYYVSPTDGKLSFINGADALTFKYLQTINPGGDLHSGFGDPLLSHPSDAMQSMDLRPADLSPAERTGLEIAGITDDLSGTLRSSNTPTDIGAYSGNMVRNNSTQDIFCPVIQFEKLGSASSLTNRLTKNFATITDNGGEININPGTKPRLYYKLSSNADAFVGNTASDNGWKWVEATGVISPFDFNIDYSQLFGGPVALNSKIQYFVVAQNLSSIPNVTFYPTKGATGVSVSQEGMIAPQSPYNYDIVASVPAIMNVGTGQSYTSLTGTGGVFDVINSGSINENIFITIHSDLNEPGTKILNHINEDGANAGTLSITIQSDGTSHIISGSNINSNSPLISLSGVERLMIDGSVNKFLTFRNTNSTPSSTGPVFQFDNSCHNNCLTNCNIESNSAAVSSGTVFIGSAGQNSVTISQNDIRDSRGNLKGSPLIGIYSNSAGNKLNIIDNNVYNLKNNGSYGIYLNLVANGCTIKSNSIYLESGFSALGSFTGIWVGYSNNHFITENYVGGSAPKCGGNIPFTISGPSVFTGINTYHTSMPELILQGNTIQNIKMTDTSTPVFNGINNFNGPAIITSNTIGSNSNPNSIQLSGKGISSGILQSNPGSVYSSTIEKNTIANISLINSSGSPTFCALNMSGGIVRMNSIYRIGSPVQSLTPVIYGIKNSVGVAFNEFSNNIISLDGGEATSSTIYGFYEDSSSGSSGFYYNSINLFGSASRDSSTYAYYSLTNTSRVLKNNILVNTRMGGTGKHFAIYSSTISGLVSDFNDLYCSGPTLGHSGASDTANDIYDLTYWKNSTNQDANSISIDPLFTTPKNLLPADSSQVNRAGIPVTGISTDISGIPRNLVSPTVGAYELKCNCPSFGGTISPDQLIGNSLPDLITTIAPASGFNGKLEYKWQNSESPFTEWTNISESNKTTYQPGILTKTTKFKRLARTTCIKNWTESVESNVVTLTMAVNKWKGIKNNYWNDPENWTLNRVPEANDDIVIDDFPVRDCLLDQDRTVNEIMNNQSAYRLDLNGKALTIKGNLNFTNGAKIVSSLPNSTIIFSGEAFQTIPSNAFLNNKVNCMTIDNAVGVSPDSDFTIERLLSINPGKKLIIPTGTLLNVEGTINNNAGTSGLVIKAHPSGLVPTGSLIFHNDTSMGSFVSATVEMYSKAAKTDGHYKWQFFGIPLRSMPADPTFYGSFVREMHEDVTGTTDHWVQLQNESFLTSFKGYEITQQSGKIITFEGILENAGFGPKQLTYTTEAFYKGQHLIGNPYTAAINIKNEENPANSLAFGDGMDKTIYLYNTGSADDWSNNGLNGSGNDDAPGQYLSIPQENAGSNLLPSSIPSMQAFLVMVKEPGSSATITIPYNSIGAMVKNTSLHRVTSQKKISTRIDVVGSDSIPGDRMWIFTDPTCTRGFDNGWDGYKIMGATSKPQLFAIEDDGEYQVNSVNDINNTYLGFKAGTDTLYTLKFIHQNVDDRYRHLYLMDLSNSTTVDITTSHSQYHFVSIPGNELEKRFKIIATKDEPEIPTEDKSIDATHSSLSVFNTGNIILVKNQSDLNGNLYLYDLTGRFIQKLPFYANEITSIPINIPAGSYLSKAVTLTEQMTTKLIFGK